MYEFAVAETTSTTLMMASVGLLLAIGMIIWYAKLQGFFDNAGGNMEGAAASFTLPHSGR